MQKSRETTVLQAFFLTYIPNRRDNVRQLVLKSFYLLAFVAVLAASTVLSVHFWSDRHQLAVLDEARTVWYAAQENGSDPFGTLQAENGDFKGWIRIPGTQVDNPFYQAKDDSYYLDRNQRKEKSRYGSLFLSSENKISSSHTDQNLILFGHNMKDGSMFGSLSRLRSFSFFKTHSTVELTTEDKKSVYSIYAVFVLNAHREDDGGYIYNIYRNGYQDETDFENWVNEAKERSLIKTGVDVDADDDILTLVTYANDFPDARLIVMAREAKTGDKKAVSSAAPNPSPRYPKRWYEDKKIPYPYAGGKNDVS